ncbi:isocitrate lyase/PEP mutase family protein [Agrobacterium bohemicum]|uniref:Phosphonomutase n=1 Tax=Agrobacterium bohemicum TaxID=2052828 RepID=A0A135P6G7_9HYPH|nr:isocitrate lyase/phosphoenolpyruvate mutase family protein [Agrobacterium bohemicum]KXG87027.1 phosphonomutase [Agrobacterium bohemicum]
MINTEKAKIFRDLHIQGNPVILYNIWDAGSAKAVAAAGASAIATGSWSLAASQGYEDGQNLPLDLALDIVARIVASTDLPVTVDFESGYAVDPQDITRNVSSLLQTGAIGLNFEDQVIGGEGIYDVATQAVRITAARQAAIDSGVPAVINARTDLFLQESDPDKHDGLVDDAISRAIAYKEAGADCFFIPGLPDEILIARICAAIALPVNVMVLDTNADLSGFSRAGVARVSFGPAPYFAAMKSVEQSASKYK